MNKCTMSSRLYSRNIRGVKSSKIIRKEFLNYFVNDLDHKYVKSSPVLPLCDPTVPFVNAGMNQFKSIFLGLYNPPAPRVANSQKCIRIGGKHNDLEVVGHDTYHHTFFEMLGNWSFGDYFKEKACEYAWNLITGPYGINKNCLYVTYFGGDEKMGLKPDLECQDIWLRLGVPRERILPFGMKDNFWEMGVTGPCGPCTEIHVAHTMQTNDQSSRVNKGHSDLTELWNIVFIEYERLANGQISTLPQKHVDTGMGFERLVAFLQGQQSNYDTDLFTPLFEAIQRKTNRPAYRGRLMADDEGGIDAGYRIMADHARMVTIALADGMLPTRNPKLRRVLRKAISVGEDVFRTDGLLRELSFHVAESLGDVYPEVRTNLNRVQKMIEFEEEWLKSLKKNAGKEWQKIVNERPELAAVSNITAPGLVPAYKELHSRAPISTGGTSLQPLPPEMAYKMYDTYGLDPETMSELAKVESFSFDRNEFEKVLNEARQRSKAKHGKSEKDLISQASLQLLESNKVPKTDDSFKYDYSVTNNEYKFPAIESKLVGIIVNGELKSGNNIHTGARVGIILDKTPFYAPEGGQASDTGCIRIKNLVFDIDVAIKIRDYVVHFGQFATQEGRAEVELRLGDDCTVTLDSETRIGLMRHHTATHLLNAALHEILPVTGQNGSSVYKDSLDFQFNVFGEKLSHEHVQTVERRVNDAIKANVDVSTRITNSLGLSEEESLTLVPGEIYPETGIRIVDITSHDLKSKEACCGTHVRNTGILDYFCILKVKSEGTGSRSVKAITGPLARRSKLAGDEAKEEIAKLEQDVNNESIKVEALETRLQEIKSHVSRNEDRVPLSYTVTQECLSKLGHLAKIIKIRKRNSARNLFEAELRNIAPPPGSSFIVHCLQLNDLSIDLEKIGDVHPKIPCLVLVHNQGLLKATCHVPEETISTTFNARSWMETVLRIIGTQGSPIKGQDPMSIYSMRIKQLSPEILKTLIEKATTEAAKFAKQNIERPERDKK